MADTSLLLPSPPPPPCAPPHWRRGAANERRLCWGVMRAAAWKARAALLYSVGGWTALFGMMYYTRQGGGGDDGPENENDPQTNPVPHKEVYTSETPLGFQVRTEIIYKDVQPPVTRLLRRVVSFFDSSGNPPSEK